MKNVNEFKAEEISLSNQIEIDGGKHPTLRELVHDAVHILFGACNGGKEH